MHGFVGNLADDLVSGIDALLCTFISNSPSLVPSTSAASVEGDGCLPGRGSSLSLRSSSFNIPKVWGRGTRIMTLTASDLRTSERKLELSAICPICYFVLSIPTPSCGYFSLRGRAVRRREIVRSLLSYFYNYISRCVCFLGRDCGLSPSSGKSSDGETVVV